MVAVATVTANRANGLILSGSAEVVAEPPVAQAPSSLVRGHDYIAAVAYPPQTPVDGRVAPIVPTVRKRLAPQDRIIVGGRDVTYYRDVPTPLPYFRLTQPLGYGATTLVFPQTHAAFETPGTGDLRWLDKEKGVRFERLDPTTGARRGIDYLGVITAVRAQTITVDGGSRLVWVADVGGDLSGRLALKDQQPPLWRRPRDLGKHVYDLVRGARLVMKPRYGPTTDIELVGQGGMSQLDWANHLCSMAVKKNGDQYTLMPSLTRPRIWRFKEKDTTTRHATVYFDDGNVVPDLVDDLAEQPNMVYGTGVLPTGMKVKNGIYPGLKPSAPPPFPGFLQQGATGPDVAVMNWKLVAMGYLSDERDEIIDQFTADSAAAVELLQEDAGLTVSGDMNSNTWDALFDLGVTGFSLRQSKIMPMAQRNHVRKWNRTANGSRASRNPAYDPTRLPVHRTVDFGAGHTKARMVKWARREIGKTLGKNWVGTITVNTGAVIRGEHTPGVALTEASTITREIDGGFVDSKFLGAASVDGGTVTSTFASTVDAGDTSEKFGVMSVRALRPGMNVWAPLFDGGTLFHIAGIDYQGKTAVLTVDTKFRDMLTVAEIVNRNRESRRDPARAWLNQNKSNSRAEQPQVTFDEVGGRLYQEVACPANEWTVFPVVAGQEGTIRKLRVQTRDTEAAFCLTVWGKNPIKEALDKKVPTPLAIDEETGETVWSETKNIFDRRLLLYAAGDDEQPCGYYPKKHTNDRGETTTHPITGEWVDEAQFSYHTDVHPVLWVAIWPKQACKIRPQRIMWPQLEEGQ